MGKAFLSYMSEDAAAVQTIQHRLTEVGFDVWWDRANLIPGLSWSEAIERAIAEADFFLPCFSHHTARRTDSYMVREIHFAGSVLASKGRSPWFIPLQLSKQAVPSITLPGGCKVEDLHWIDLSRDFEQGMIELCSRLFAVQKPGIPFAMNIMRILEGHVTAKIEHYARAKVPSHPEIEASWRTMLDPDRSMGVGKALFELGNRAKDAHAHKTEVYLEPSANGIAIALTYVPYLSVTEYVRQLASLQTTKEDEAYEALVVDWKRDLCRLSDWVHRDLAHVLFMCDGDQYNFDVLYLLGALKRARVYEELLPKMPGAIFQCASMYPTSVISSNQMTRLEIAVSQLESGTLEASNRSGTRILRKEP